MMPKINVLYIVDTLQIGGAEKQVVSLVKNIDRTKYRVFLCCMRNEGPLKEEIENVDVMLYFLRMKLRYFFVALYKLIRFMKKQNIQIVHTHLYTSSVWGRLAGVLSRVPVIITTEHGRGMWKQRRHLLFERIANRFTDMRIAVSHDVREIRIKMEHTPPDKVVTVPNAISPDEFLPDGYASSEIKNELGLDPDVLIVGTVARFDPDKALDRMLDACSVVLRAAENVRILLVGDGDLMKYLKSYAARLGIDQKVIFTGTRKDIAALLGAIDVYVNSSVREGIPVSLLEAMAAKKVVVATNVGGNREVINCNSCGIIVESGDTEAIARAVLALLHDEEMRKRMGEKARERILQNYSITAQVRKIELIYENLLIRKSVFRGRASG